MSSSSSVVLFCFLLKAFVEAVLGLVGGSLATPGDFPYQVSLKLNGEHHCGGAIISAIYILTIEKCLVNQKTYLKYPVSNLSVQAGTAFRQNGGVTIPVANTHFYEDKHRFDNFDNFINVALVRLQQPLIISETIKPIAILSDQLYDFPDNFTLVISGLGQVRQNGPKPSQLQWLALPADSINLCYYPERLFCWRHPLHEGICDGDLGVPAVVGEQLVGVASIAAGCGPNELDAFTAVSSYVDWIFNTTDVNQEQIFVNCE